MKDRYLELLLSFITLALIVIAIIIFIYTGGSVAFYAVTVVAIIVGFINALLISRIGSEEGRRPRRGSAVRIRRAAGRTARRKERTKGRKSR